MTEAVASFTCHCGARDEVREPAPATVDCWNCRKPLAMERWRPAYDPPFQSARLATNAERARLTPPSPSNRSDDHARRQPSAVSREGVRGDPEARPPDVLAALEARAEAA